MTHMRKDPAGGQSELHRRPNTYFPGKPSTILVVEDNPDEAVLIEAVLATGLSQTEVDVPLIAQDLFALKTDQLKFSKEDSSYARYR